MIFTQDNWCHGDAKLKVKAMFDGLKDKDQTGTLTINQTTVVNEVVVSSVVVATSKVRCQTRWKTHGKKYNFKS